jgi:hypothetical protein
VDGEGATGVSAGGHTEFGEDGFGFVFEGHGWLVFSVEVVGGWWQPKLSPP